MKRLILAIVLASAPAGAETVLTVDAAMALAREHNRDLAAARAHLDATQAAVDQARAALLPTLAAQGRFTHNNKQVGIDLGALGIGHSVVIQKSEQLDGSLNASVPIVVPSAYYQLSSARSAQRANQANYVANEAGVLYAVAQAYYAAVGMDELVRARQAAVSVASETLDVAKARVAARVANRVDATRAETALVRAEQDLAEANNTQAQAYRALATLIGTQPELVLKSDAELPPEPPGLEALVTQAQNQRAELRAEREQHEAYGAAQTAAALRWAPTLSGFASGHIYNYAGFSGDKYAWAAGLQLDWLLFDGGVRDADRSRAEANGREVEWHLAQLGASVTDEVANARGTLSTKRKAVQAAERAVTLARDTLNLVRAQYGAGSALELDVLGAQDSLVSAEVGLAQAHFDVELADLALRRAVGALPGKAR
ncbi:MAG TPA: TolC family protein [Polyangiaceae bacterium]|nr:TolC family protein [Polyangiaceae bacterium]